MYESTSHKKNSIRRFFGMYAESAKEFSSLLTIVICGLMAALSIVLSTTTSFYITSEIKIGFSGVPNRIVDFIYGPVVGCVFGGVMDLVKFLIKPDGVFFPGYTLTAMLGGLIYGTFFYRLQIKQPQNGKLSGWITSNLKSILLIFIAEILVKVFCNIGLNTLWSCMFTGKAFWAVLPLRITKNLIQIPVDTVFHFFIIKMVSQLKRYLLPTEGRFAKKKPSA